MMRNRNLRDAYYGGWLSPPDAAPLTQRFVSVVRRRLLLLVRVVSAARCWSRVAATLAKCAAS